MTKNNKFVLSLATIAILSGTNALATAVNIDNAALKDKGDSSGVYTADVSTADETDGVTITSKIEKKDDIKDMTKLVISTDKKLAIGTSSQSSGVVSIGGTKPTGDAQADGYGFDINAKSLTTTGATSPNDTQLNVNADSSISTTEGAKLGENSSISIANGKTLTINGNLTTSDTSSKISINGGSLNLSGDLTATNGTLSLGENGKLDITGKLTGTAGEIKLGGGTMSVNGALNQTNTTINFDGSSGGGTLNVNGGGTLDGTKLTLTNGGSLNFNAASGASADKPTTSTISGKVESTADNALNITLGRNTKVSFTDTTDGLILKNASDTALDKITLGGGSLNVAKITADATNFDTTSGGVIDFTNDGSKISGDFTINSGTTLKFSSATNTAGTTFDNLTASGSSKLDFAQGTMKVTNLTTNASNISFDKTNGGTIELANGGNSTISGNLELGTGANIKISAATLNVGNLSATKTGKITLGGGVLNVAQGLNIANAGSTKDSNENVSNIDISEGGVINFNGGNSSIGGELKTTANKATTLDVNQNANVSFEDLNLATSGVLSLDGGVVNVGKLATAAADNLSLTKGTLNFMQTEADNKANKTTDSTIADLTLADDSTAVLNFNDKSSVTISKDLDLGKTSATLNFNSGSLVKISGTNSSLTARTLNLNGGQINLKKLAASKTESSNTLNLRFAGASASVKGDLSNTAAFTLGTDDKGNHFIGKTGETFKITDANSALSLNSGVINTNGTLTTEASGGKLVFNGGSLNVGAGGSLTIADTSKNLELKDGVGGLLTLKGDGTKGGSMTISDGDLDLSKTSLGIKIENGGKLTTTKASKISGNGNTIALSDYTGIRINGDITTAANGEFSYEKMGDLTLGKETTLGIITLANADGDLQEITAGKITADADKGSTLAFGNGGLVNLKGSVSDTTALKLNNAGFGSGLTLAENSVLEFAGGSVDVKGALSVEAGKTATLKVSNAVANLNGGFDATNYVKTIELDSGALNIKQDKLTATGLDITHIQRNAGGISSVMNIDGEASITGSKFAILPLVETGATSYKVLSTTKGLSVTDINKGTTGEFRTRNSLNDILGKYGLSVDESKIKDGDKVIAAKDSSVKVTLKNDGKNLFLERELTNLGSLSDVKAAKIQADIDMLTAMASDTDIVDTNDKSNVENLATELETLKNSAKNQSSVELAAEMGGSNSDILLSAFGVKSGATSSATRNAVMLDIMETGGAGIVKDIKDGASSVANMSSSTSSIMNTMNLSNDMAISGRIAQANNPYGNLAQGFAGYEYAAVSGDLPLYYSNNGYKNGFWANAIGGLNKVEGESGILMGLSAGFDRQLENTLVGFYLSYAMANLNDKVVEQSADNIQVGLYTSFNQRDIEVNVKAYGQLAVTETTAKRAAGEATAKFNRLYGGLSANIGTIFALNNNSTFIKPFIGENYYYAHTPAYEESLHSDAALSVKSANNHALSFDVGVDVRQYWNENSFVYITPSVERYVVNSGGDYTAGFLGSDTTFTIEGKSKTKTYLQALLGGNIALGDKFNINVGLGVKKILSGQIERDNGDKIDELYLSGNLGVKYRF